MKKTIVILSIILVVILLSFVWSAFYNHTDNTTIEIPNQNTSSALSANDTLATTKDTIIATSSSFIIIDLLELPNLVDDEVIIEHTGFRLVYSETHEQAKWIAYEFTKAETIKKADRTDDFRPDPKVLTGSATSTDYKGSGFDRGHLAPAGDLSWSADAMSCSFFYSNMSPQTPSFNRGIWKKLEEQVRDWAKLYDTIYVVTGPVLEDSLPTIGENKVSIPKYYYKVILEYKSNVTKAIGFILPNKKSSFPLNKFIVSIDSVEQMTGIDFFHQLPDSIENKIEKSVCNACWGMN
ncbi:MAG: DNA/RNA endonuclease [Flavobacteriales bacterium]|nr:DNA/RNA endonuclease [Flavobacteriales bacterium]|tara:strand:+ start:214838 stop:215719 length:882 start_codon:yes stop_codon:yes gene_type:complete